MQLFDAFGPNPTTVRLFILERGGLDFETVPIDIQSLENRGIAYRTEINPRGEVPALVLEGGRVITEVTAICEYLDEVAKGGDSLIGDSAAQRAETRMWTRRVDLEICQHFVNWWRNGVEGEDFYRGHRIAWGDSRCANKLAANQGLNRLDEELGGGTWLCGGRFSLADVFLYAFMSTMEPVVPWLNVPGRSNVVAWLERMRSRPSAAGAATPFRAGLFSSPD